MRMVVDFNRKQGLDVVAAISFHDGGVVIMKSFFSPFLKLSVFGFKCVVAIYCCVLPFPKLILEVALIYREMVGLSVMKGL